MHYYVLLNTKPEEHNRVNRTLIGPLTEGRPAAVDERAGFAPPSWWRGDEHASRSSLLAATGMRR